MSDTLTQLRSGQLIGTTRLDLRCGLTEFPREILDLADSLEILNLTGNQLRELPNDFARLKNLRILFCSENQFTHLPAVLGQCPKLEMIGFKANQIETIDATAFSESLRWLILTDNRLRELPATLGRCIRLQKLMLAGNRLTRLPDEMAACTHLELLRLAANDLESLPPWLLYLPRLTWLAFAGNPCSASPHASAPSMAQVPWSTLELQDKLGEGASGHIHRALWRKTNGDQAVAVKLFKGAVTSDGLPSCEMDACLAAAAHHHLIPVHGQVTDHPNSIQGLVLSLIDPVYTTLAGPPSFESCTRDIYAEGQRFMPSEALSIALGIASAAQHLHARGIMHGDLYAHNILWNPNGHCYLGDFGGATFYDLANTSQARALQALEARAIGCLLEELLQRTDWTQHQEAKGLLLKLQHDCMHPEVHQRPTFTEIITTLENAGHALQEAAMTPV